MSRVNKVRLVGIALISATILALLSVYVERVGPELAQYGDSDFRPVLKSGFRLRTCSICQAFQWWGNSHLVKTFCA